MFLQILVKYYDPHINKTYYAVNSLYVHRTVKGKIARLTAVDYWFVGKSNSLVIIFARKSSIGRAVYYPGPAGLILGRGKISP
jgi:hypothetical protein